jgi:NAD(P)-dependent dehydrogenase (short-subunit alcohol dehydrogenase family)
MPKLDGKVAVITGATSGMALATAKLFVAEGAHAYITGRDRNRLDEAVASIGHNVTGVQADSGSLNDLARLAETVREHHGRVDVLFASAGVGSVSDPLGSITPETFDAMVGVNFRGTVFTVQYLLPLMSDGASIILNGTTSATKGVPGAGVYSASKAAVRSLARTWAAELSVRGIRVNVVSPGSIDTALFSTVSPEFRELITAAIPLGRLGTSAEIGTTALFLASSDSSFITGANLVVDGGFSQI